MILYHNSFLRSSGFKEALMMLGNVRKVAKVVVLGDIGRSPRMQYHALSLANNGLDVKIISYVETDPLPEVLNNPHITVIKLHPFELKWGPVVLKYIAKTLWQSVSLMFTLFLTGRCDYLLGQNPPAIPSLPVFRLYCMVSKAQFVIDWHNYAYSIMAMTLEPDHMLVRMARSTERFFGQSSHFNLCVTYAMKEDLLQNWNINAAVLYDRPPKIFKPLTLLEKHDWYVKMAQNYPMFGASKHEKPNEAFEKTAFTEYVDGVLKPRPDRPGIIFSSTSWTPDEDFTLLMEALQVYETTYSLTKVLPRLICVITGKGPMREYYRQLVDSKKWKNVDVVTPWLDASDYPRMVASADLGVCLHTSSSGLDLPMKVVDMFGAGLPVCAFNFLCLDELVEDGVNGFTFKTGDELAKLVVNWFTGFPDNPEQIALAERMRRELAKFRDSRWEDNWDTRAKKIFEN